MEVRDGTEKEKPWPERIWWVSWRTTDSMADWTEERDRSDTSRHVDERDRSASVKGFELEEEEEEEEKDLSIWRMWSSDLRRCLKGCESESESARRRFFLSDMELDFLCGGKISQVKGGKLGND